MEAQFSFYMELQKMAIDWLRKQGGNVVLLSLGIVWLWNYSNAQVSELKAVNQKNEIRIEELVDEVRKCDTERARLESRVEWLVAELSNRFPRLKKQADEH